MVGTGNPVDQIWASDDFGVQQAFLPTHFASRELNFGGNLGIGVSYQFGSPLRMYIDAGGKITLSGDSNNAGRIFASAVGHLIAM